MKFGGLKNELMALGLMALIPSAGAPLCWYGWFLQHGHPGRPEAEVGLFQWLVILVLAGCWLSAWYALYELWGGYENDQQARKERAERLREG